MSSLVVVHYHWRPGGVRTVAKLGAPLLAQALGCDKISFLSGEDCPELGYGMEADPARYLDAALENLEPGSVIWAHNISLGRNPRLGPALAEAARKVGAVLLLHHHDWWFDRRPERSAALEAAAAPHEWMLPSGPHIRHAVLSRDEAAVLEKCAGASVVWSPNPIFQNAILPNLPLSQPPTWLMPCRILARKNIIEGYVLTRILRPEARLVIAGDVGSSPQDSVIADMLDRLPGVERNAAHRHSMEQLAAPAECILTTSTQEGFGLASLEAMQWGKPLIQRRLPRITADLESLGCRFAMVYDDFFLGGKSFSRYSLEEQMSLALQLPNREDILAENPWLGARLDRPLQHSTLPEISLLQPAVWAARLAALVRPPNASGAFDGAAAQRALRELLVQDDD